MRDFLSIPEIAALDAPPQLVRIPPEVNVPLTDRVRRLIDTAPFRRLANVSQLGLVSLVYPGATHRRFEHSLGVYRQALLFIRQLAGDSRFAGVVTPRDVEVFLVAALLHDIGHWPFCHPIEDLRLSDVPRHEELAAEHLDSPEIASSLREDWGIAPDEILRLLAPKRDAPRAERILQSMLSGPIDVDKLDYLGRDSLHAGVPYGRHFDHHRLVGSLCLNEAGDGIAISEKGRTAAELLVFARYVMFSEVYWHHGVRAATAMLQRAFFQLRRDLDLRVLFGSSDEKLASILVETALEQRDGPSSREIVGGLFGHHRRLYKRAAQFTPFDDAETYAAIAYRPFRFLVDVAVALAERTRRSLGVEVQPHEVIIDAPPVAKEIEFRIDVFSPKEKRYRPLEVVSPVVRTLAREQFDDWVKRVRVFVHPRVASLFRSWTELPRALREVAEEQAQDA